MAKEKPKFYIEVKVSGPGTTFGGIVRVIKTALQAAGVSVFVEDEYPDPDDSVYPDSHLRGRDVVLKTNHLPWGG